MRLLHLSDIHFREPDCLNPKTDPDVPFRTRLTNDAVQLCHESGTPVDAILVGGDIAYKAHPKEYEVAEHWLRELADKCGCPAEKIFVVPGNHDVDRGICNKSQSVINAQTMIAQAGNRREKVLRGQLNDPDTALAIFLPLAAYNEFAAKFGCNVYSDRLYWEFDLEIERGVKIRLFGLTSTLISGLGDRDKEPGKLYLSRLQTVLNPEPDTINLVICHHPPSWFVDCDDIDDAVTNRAPIQLFGHKHRQRCLRPPEYIRFMAGAVNPDRDEPDWRPGYNMIDISVNGEGSERSVDVRAHVRHLQTTPEMFVPLLTAEGEKVWSHRLPCKEVTQLGFKIPAPGTFPPLRVDPRNNKQSAANTTAADEVSKPSAEAVMSQPSTKNLVFRFWALSISQRRDIALELNLMTSSDLAVPEPERYARALKAAAEKGLLGELALRIEQIEQDSGHGGK